MLAVIGLFSVLGREGLVMLHQLEILLQKDVHGLGDLGQLSFQCHKMMFLGFECGFGWGFG